MADRSAHPAASEGLLEHLKHSLFKKPVWTYLRGVHPLVILTSPIIYYAPFRFSRWIWRSVFYQAICFPVYGIAKVPSRAVAAVPASLAGC